MRIRKSTETRKAEIIEATLCLADRFGPDRLTTEAVAEAVGLSQPGIFRHFPKKQALWEAVAAHIGTEMETRWKRVQKSGASPLDRLRGLIAAQLRLLQTIPAIPAILFSRELHTMNDDLREAFFRLMGRFHGLVAALIDEACKAGELRDDLNPDDVAFLIVGLVQGLAVRWSISGREFSLRKEGERLLALQLSGFTCVVAAGAERRAS